MYVVIDANVGFVLGSNCTVLRTDDAGVNWTAQNTPGTIDNTIYGIDFPTADTYIAAGRFGRIYHSTDAGYNWVPETITTEVLLDILFLNSSTGFVVGSNSFLHKTTDGGNSWTPLSTGSSSLYFSSISFADANHGFIAGGNVGLNMGTITSTNNGGNTWDTEYTGTSRLYDVFVSPKGGYACGLDGSILKYTPSGLDVTENSKTENLLDIYPNPSSDHTLLVLPQTQKAIRLTVFDYNGRTVKQLTFSGVSSIYLPSQELAAGQYIVQVFTQNGTSYTQKLVIRH